MGPGGLATPGAGGCLRAPPPNPYDRSAAGGPGGRWGSVVLGWRALRPPRVVFVLGFVYLIHSLTSGKRLSVHVSVYVCVCVCARTHQSINQPLTAHSTGELAIELFEEGVVEQRPEPPRSPAA
eukprot:scaffold21663_cov85-Phaeocystis_antarctica.AAC.1